MSQQQIDKAIEEVEGKELNVRGRGKALYGRFIIQHDGSIRVRLDDARNPEFWAEVYIDRETAKLLAIAAEPMDLVEAEVAE